MLSAVTPTRDEAAPQVFQPPPGNPRFPLFDGVRGIAAGPARSRSFDDGSSIRLWPASVYAVKTLWAGVRLMLHRRGVVPSKKFRP